MRELRRDWCDGGIKLATIVTLLRHRQTHESLYSDGDYQPLPSTGARADEICAYARARNGDRLIVVVARRARRHDARIDDYWQNTVIALAEHLRRDTWQELLSGRTIPLRTESISAAEILADLPLAVLSAPAGR